MSLSQKFSTYVKTLAFSEVDNTTVESVKSRIIDYICVTAAATHYSDLSQRLYRFADELVGSEGGLPAYPANVQGFLNAALAHCLDYDDGHLWAGIHASGPVIGTAFALVPGCRPSGARFIESIIAGYELEYRLGKALGKSLIQKGFHGSCVCGVIGAATTAGKLLGLDEVQLTYALGLAGLGALGNRQPLVEGQMAKPIQVGYVADIGIKAALLAKSGVEAPLEIFEGKKGMFSLFSDTPRDRLVGECLANLGGVHLINETYTKLYPCNRYAHPAIEAAFKLRKSIIDLNRISEIVVNTFDIAIEATAPNENPRDVGESRFSMNYLVAVALHQGSVGLDDFSETALCRADVRATAEKLKSCATNEWNDAYPAVRGAEVVVKTHDQVIYSEKVDKLSGMSGDHHEVRQKFLISCKAVFPEGRSEKILRYVDEIDGLDSIADLISITRVFPPKEGVIVG